MEDVRWAWTSEAEAGEDGVETLTIRRDVVVGVMPKRRKDSAICRSELKIRGSRWKPV
jgi:hypothetical protein